MNRSVDKWEDPDLNSRIHAKVMSVWTPELPQGDGNQRQENSQKLSGQPAWQTQQKNNDPVVKGWKAKMDAKGALTSTGIWWELMLLHRHT